MSFRARCVFCTYRVRVPDRALGGSARCPRCDNFFTLAPEEELDAVGAAASAGALVQERRAAKAVPLEQTESLSQPQDPLDADDDVAKIPWIDPVGLAALLLDGAALLGASVSALAGGVVWLSALGLLFGVLAWIRLWASRSYRMLFAASGAILGGIILIAALLTPGILGPAYETARQKDPIDASAIRAIPLAGNPAAEPSDPEWADASRFALQQGRMNVHVVSVIVGRPATNSLNAHDAPPPPVLFLRLRFLQGGGAQDAKDGESPPFIADKSRLKLFDDSGRTYARREVTVAPAKEKKQDRRAFPVDMQSELFVFEAPPPAADPLRLELPAETWGGKGWFRFAVPRSMIRHEAVVVP
jgi:hypothetical protein